MLKATKKYSNREHKRTSACCCIDNCSLELQFYSNAHYFPLSLLSYPEDVNAYFSDHDTPLLEQPGQLLLY